MGSKLWQPTKRFVLDQCKNGHVPYWAPQEVDQGVEDPVVPVGHRSPLAKSNCWWQSSKCWRRWRLAGQVFLLNKVESTWQQTASHSLLFTGLRGSTRIGLLASKVRGLLCYAEIERYCGEVSERFSREEVGWKAGLWLSSWKPPSSGLTCPHPVQSFTTH